MKLYLVRHGQSTYNALMLHQHGEVELSEQGIEQARFVAKRFTNVAIDVILASPYPRTKKTAETINEVVKKDIVFLHSLREFKRPTEIEGKRIDDPGVVAIKQHIRTMRNDPSWHHSDEESDYDFKKRVESFIEELNERKEENILTVTHELVIKMLVAILMHESDKSIDMYWHIYDFFTMGNTGITLLEKKNNKWHLVTWNDQAHLGELI